MELAGLLPPRLQRRPELAVRIGARDQHLGQGYSPPVIVGSLLQGRKLSAAAGQWDCAIAGGVSTVERATTRALSPAQTWLPSAPRRPRQWLLARPRSSSDPYPGPLTNQAQTSRTLSFRQVASLVA